MNAGLAILALFILFFSTNTKSDLYQNPPSVNTYINNTIYAPCSPALNSINNYNLIMNINISCEVEKNEFKSDAEQCINEAKTPYAIISPSGIVTLAIYPIIYFVNLINKTSAENASEELFEGCMAIKGYVFNGQGIRVYESGDKYEGEFINGAREGRGTYIWKNGNKYIGEWESNDLNGHGIFYWANGDRYEGEWKNGNREGEGTLTLANGVVNRGEWRNDVLIKKY